MNPSRTHLVLIPSYNSGARLAATVEEALARWSPVWVVVDGSTDRSDEPVRARAEADPRLRVIARERNGGKGAAVATGVEAALQAGFTHVLTMDADGQHPAERIGAFMQASLGRPDALVLGRPIFGSEAPPARLHGRKLSVALARLEILGPGIDDPLFGFRVYPAAALRRALASTRHARRFDFDHEAAVRMVWAGTPTINLPAPCRYLSAGEGGVSHFHYLRDNAVLIWLHFRLIAALAAGKWIAVRRLRRAVLAVALLVGAGSVRAAPPAPLPPPFIADPQHDPAWTGLFARLAPNRSRDATFEERRYFPFRRDPVVLEGELRIAPGRGLSLAYLKPEPRILIVDDRGLIVRDAAGRDRPIPEQGAAFASTLVDLIRFDLPRLTRVFELRGERQGENWTLMLVPRRPAAVPFQGIAVEGTGARLARIVLTRSARERVEILIGPTRDNVVFPPGVVARYFR